MKQGSDFVSDFLANLENLAVRAVSRNSRVLRPMSMANQSICVIDALAARQASLLFQFTRNIALWNPHGAPVLLRSMVECFIIFKWICVQPIERTQRYFNYGIGQARQFADVYNEFAAADPENETFPFIRDLNIKFVESFRHLAFVDANLGDWTGTNTRTLSKEIDEEDLYRGPFAQFSATTHNTFYHTGLYNLRPCTNEAHPRHLIPTFDDRSINPDILYSACKYFDLVDITYRNFLGKNMQYGILSRYFARNQASLLVSLTANS